VPALKQTKSQKLGKSFGPQYNVNEQQDGGGGSSQGNPRWSVRLSADAEQWQKCDPATGEVAAR